MIGSANCRARRKQEVNGPLRSARQLQLVLHWQFSADLYKENSLLKTKTIEFWANSHTVLTDESSEPPRV